MRGNLFYQGILVLLVEGFMDIIISSFLNICDYKAFKTGLGGEILSFIWAWLGLIASILLIGLLVFILKMSRDDINEVNFA